METVDWEMEKTEGLSEHVPFSENQVGSITLTLEPVHAGSPIDWVAQQFLENPELMALPVEKDGGVIGLISRARILQRSTRFLESVRSRPLDHYLSPHRELDARESVDKVVAALLTTGTQALTDLYLVYLHGQYFGVTDLRRLVSRSAFLREQDLGKAREIQEGTMAKARLPKTTWQRAKLVRMAYGVGGDFYQELAWADGACFLGCFDVSGKGISGALITSSLGGFFAAVPTQDPAPHLWNFALQINNFLRDTLPLGTFVTGILIKVAANPGEAFLQLLNFGYGPVYTYHCKNKTVSDTEMAPNLPPLGLDSLPIDESSLFLVPFEPGTKVYTFSDGLTDLMNPSGQRYGEDRLHEFLANSYQCKADEFLTQVETEIQTWQGSAPQADDITILTIQA